MKNLLSIISGWFMAAFVYFFNKKQDEVATLQAKLDTINIDNEIKPLEVSLEKAKSNADNKVLIFKSLRERFRDVK